MAKTATTRKQVWQKMYRDGLKNAKSYIFDKNYSVYPMILLTFVEMCISCIVIGHRSYTEIDWRTYMQQVEGFIYGTYDYAQLGGDTGPIVYPAGYVYIFAALYHITDLGTNIRRAQYIFAAIYVLNLVIVFDIYRHLKQVPGYVLVFMCCASYRIHSIYFLRLFNDAVAMVFMYLAVVLFLRDHWTMGCFIYSVGVSVKMNLLLYAPAILFLLLVKQGVVGTSLHLAVCATTQVVLAVPFLAVSPLSYLAQSFNLARQFSFKWTVNWRFLPEDIFLDRRLHVALISLHVIALVLFATFKWNRIIRLKLKLGRSPALKLSPHQIVWPLFTCNLLGIAFCRSLHYQFYVWYFHTLHYLLWTTRLPVVCRLLLLGLVELAWNTYPSTIASSSTLHACHIVLLAALWLTSPVQQNPTKKQP